MENVLNMDHVEIGENCRQTVGLEVGNTSKFKGLSR